MKEERFLKDLEDFLEKRDLEKEFKFYKKVSKENLIVCAGMGIQILEFIYRDIYDKKLKLWIKDMIRVINKLGVLHPEEIKKENV